MQIPDDILIPTCGRCKSEFLDEDAVAILAPSLQTAYLQSLRIRISDRDRYSLETHLSAAARTGLGAQPGLSIQTAGGLWESESGAE